MLKTSSELISTTISQIEDFQHGRVRPISTGIPHLDKHLLGGFTPSTVLGICGLSGDGKTFLLEQINKNLIDEHGEDVVLLQCLWELEIFKIVVRDLSKSTNKTIKEVLFQMPDSDIKVKYEKVFDRYRGENLYFQTEPTNRVVFATDVEELISKYPDKKIVVTIDNLENILVDDETQKKAMDSLMTTINKLKKTHPFIVFIILNQLNREMAERVGDPKNHFPREGDIYGTSALFKLCDVVIIKHIPYKRGVDRYGVFSNERYKYIESDFKHVGAKTSSFNAVGVVFYHYVKSRNIEEEYDKMDVFAERLFYAPKISSGYSPPSGQDDEPEFLY